MDGLKDGLSCLGSGIAWAGLWIGIGIANLGESNVTHNISFDDKKAKDLISVSADVVKDFIEKKDELKEEVKK